MDDINARLKAIEGRNKTVELDKKWETSWSRKFILIILTYLVIAIYFNFANIEKPLINAVVPSLAFVISTLSMPYFKKIWIKLNNKQKRN